MIEFRGSGFTITVPQSSLSANEGNADLLVQTADGRQHAATVYTPENISMLMDKARAEGEGAQCDYFFDPSMVIVRAITGPVLLAIVTDLFKRGLFERAFVKAVAPEAPPQMSRAD